MGNQLIGAAKGLGAALLYMLIPLFGVAIVTFILGYGADALTP
ncbi:MAG TPA: hypothetical protein VLH84_04250 [Patescibacteria group bacterium]|nr:hypothetical protein [Patescibacteria group bacterium]